MTKTLATQRTLVLLREEGWSCHIVEKYIKHPTMPFGKRIDAFGIGDILAMRPDVLEDVYCPSCLGTGRLTPGDSHYGNLACAHCAGKGHALKHKRGIALVQCFPDSGGKAGFDAHREKILAIPEAKIWILAGGKIYLYGWKQRVKVKGRKKKWWIWTKEEVVFNISL